MKCKGKKKKKFIIYYRVGNIKSSILSLKNYIKAGAKI